MEHTKLPLEHGEGFSAQEKMPQEYESVPAEVEKLPVEHHIPPEYNVSQPEPAKKKYGISRMLMFAFAGFMALYLGFGYLFSDGLPGLGDNHGGEEGGSNQGGQLDNPGELPRPQDTVTFQQYQDDFANAIGCFQEDDYVGAVAAIANSLREKCNDYEPGRMDGTVMVFQDGKFVTIDGEKLKDTQGVYLWIEESIFYWEDVKDGSMYAEQMLEVSLIRVGETVKKSTQMSFLHIYMPVYNFSYGSMYCDATHLSVVMDDEFNGENAVLTVFSLGSNDYGANESTVRDNCVIYGTRRVEGQIHEGAFTGAVKLQTSGMELNDDKTQVRINEGWTDQGWMFMLDSKGVIDPESDRYADLSSYTHGEQAFTDKVNEVKADPNYYGYYYLQGGEFPQLYLKNLSPKSYEHYVYEWDTQAFPLNEILYVWAAMKPYI